MRICLASFEFIPCTNYGGAAALYYDLANGLEQLGHEVVVLSGNNQPGVHVAEVSGVTNIRFGSRYPGVGFVGRLWRASEILSKYRFAEKRFGRFDVLEAPEFGSEPIILNALRDDMMSVTRLISPSLLVARMSGKTPSFVQNLLERKNASLSSVVLADSPEWGRSIMDEWGLKNVPLKTCPLGIDLNRIDEVPHDSEIITSRYVLFSGRLTVAKGPQVLAAAAPSILGQNPSLKIVFVGADRRMPSGGSMKEHILRSIPEKFRESLVFLGRVDSWRKLVNLYRGAAVCVKADVYGNHSFDAMGQMASSKPLVCTRTEGNLDLIEDGINGLLFDRDSPEDLALIVTRLMSDENLRASIGRNARQTIERSFSSQVMSSETAKIYEEILTLGTPASL